MASMKSSLIEAKLFEELLLPSVFSGVVAIMFGVAVIAGTILLTHVGTAAQQSLIGLHLAYRNSSFGTSTQTIGTNFAANSTLNNVLLFLFWASIGLVVYSIVQNIAQELRRVHETLAELEYVNARPQSIIRDAVLHAVIRLASIGLAWLLLRFMIYHLAPYAIAAAHTSALHLGNIDDWQRSVLAGIACMVGVHGLAILLRLAMLRPRLFSAEIVE